MKRARIILQKLLHPPISALILIPVLSFAALTAIFAYQYTDSAPAYLVYGMSAYSLTVLAVFVPKMTKRIKSAIMGCGLMRKAASSKIVGRYLSDPSYRGNVGIYQGMAVNFLYVIFRVAAGIRYASVWFVSMAVYYLALGGLRAHLIICSRRSDADAEYRCYRRTAWLLFLLNIPMGGMIILMVRTNSGFSYPGYIIYLSALYTFYTVVMSVVNIVRFRKLGSPILSAAKVLNFVAAMMSILGLQTAMISRFSVNGEAYRRMMNALTGGFIYGTVIIIAVYMLLHVKNLKKEGGTC